jgi:Leucine-rich repeat (LRR) protein
VLGCRRKASSNSAQGWERVFVRWPARARRAWLTLAATGAVAASVSCGARTGLFQGDVTVDDGAGAPAGSAGAAQTGRAKGGSGGGGTSGGAGGRRACGALIDDMEDASGHICTGEGREGVWYVFNDDMGSQQPAKTSPGEPIETAAIPGGRQESREAVHTEGAGFSSWGSGIGFDLNFDGTTYRLYDATRYVGIAFWARGLPGESVTFRVSSESTTAAAYGGTCAPQCGGPFGVALALGPNWINYQVTFAELDASSQGLPVEVDRLTNVQFKSPLTQPFDFWIDDVRFLESQPSCCPDLPQCEGGAPIADPALRAAILGSDSMAQVVDCSAVCSLRSLNVTSASVRDLHGLECLGSLTTLGLSSNQISDLSPLAGLVGLSDLTLGQNQVADLAPLAKLTSLAHLDLSSNEIADISPLSTLTGLRALSINDNQLTDVKALAPLAQLQTLELSNNQIRDPSPLAGLTELTSLDLSHNALTSMTPLSGLQKLGDLVLASNSIESLGPLSGLPVLSVLDLAQNRISDPSPLSALPALVVLGLAQNRIEDPSPLRALTSLNSLDLSGNQLERLNPSFRVPSLTILNLSSNGLSQLAAMSGLSFQNLNLAHNQLTDLSALTGVTFNDIPCTRCGATPGSLDLSDNAITNLSPLLAASFADRFGVDLQQNRLTCADQAANITALQARGVTLSLDCP